MSEELPQDILTIPTQFVRQRNSLFAVADFGPLYVDYYLHLKDNRIEISPEHDAMLKDALAAFSLHCVSRPHNEIVAWTVNFQDPLLNLFLAGENRDGSVVGRIFTENIKKADDNVFYQDLIRGTKPVHRSIVSFKEGDIFFAVEEYYRQSEQRPARLFRLGGEKYAIVTAHPDYDEEWFESLTTDDIKLFDEKEELNTLEVRPVRWNCGCNHARILRTLLPVWHQDKDELFLGEELIEVNCPRCAAKYRVSRESMEAFANDQK
ncbi:Hsp33 family molecular chaperone HslO [Puniceicoccaceae bacterium K14]|nr:Hsp33 family molecular chaperone HslO [Puniceicoccaceae bacterium K14]